MCKIFEKSFLKIFMVVSMIVFSLVSVFIPKVNAAEEENVVSAMDEQVLADALRLIFEDGLKKDNEGKSLGYDREAFENTLADSDLKTEIIESMESGDLFAYNNITNKSIDNVYPIQIVPYVAACEWHSMVDKPSYTKALNNCFSKKMKENYGPVALGSTIMNLIADKEFTLAAKQILKLGIRANVAGIAFTLGVIWFQCNGQMEEEFPGKSNCMKPK
ncbi:hypothetical protein [Viridibacillus arvi]|uniref:hypothetical protein n=1 Tax=Viridibacillus arvi TaxID=263475 RepID=UPI003D29FB1B